MENENAVAREQHKMTVLNSAALSALMDLDIKRVAIREAQEEEARYHGKRVVLDEDVERFASSTGRLLCCRYCFEVFLSSMTLSSHNMMVHRQAELRAQGIIPTPTEARYHGKPLNVAFNKEERLRLRTEIRTEGCLYYCGECHEIFTSYRARTDHFRVVHSASSPEPPRQPTINSDTLLTLM
jgi:hypothetical protein